MRWDELFGDLEVAADDLAQRDRDAEIAERTRIELASLTLLDRLHAGVGQEVSLDVLGAGMLTGRLTRVGPLWLLLDVDTRHGWVVALSALTGVQGLTPAAIPAGAGRGAVGATWSSAFRTLSRDREVVLVRRVDGTAVRGVPARVGHDFVEMWWRDDEGSTDSGQRRPPRLTVIPYPALAAVQVRTGS